MPVSRAPKNAGKKKSVAKKGAVAKKSNKKVDTKNLKKGPRLFPTKAELEAQKLAKESKSAPVEKKGPRRFPTKAELEAMKAAQSGASVATAAATTAAPIKTAGKKLVEKIDGEEVELVEEEDLDLNIDNLDEAKEEFKDENEEGEAVEPGNTTPQVCNFDPNVATFIEKSSWQIGTSGLDIIKESEGFRADAYVDPGTGGEPITIGYGSTAVAIDKPVKLGDTVTKEQAEEYLVYGINKKFMPSLKKAVNIPLTQGMIDACLSLIYNIGGGNFVSSTLVKKLNKKDYCGAADEFLRWNKAAGKVLPGLTTRRNKERDIFLS